MRAIARFLQSEDGPAAVEYGVMLALIILSALAAINTVGSTNGGLWGDINTKASNALNTANATLGN